MADPTTLDVQEVTSVGVELEFTAADTTNGNRWKNTGREILEIKNTGASTAKVTVVTPLTMDGLDIDDREIDLDDGETFHATFPRTDVYNDSNGWTVIEASGTGAADLEYAVFKR